MLRHSRLLGFLACLSVMLLGAAPNSATSQDDRAKVEKQIESLQQFVRKQVNSTEDRPVLNRAWTKIRRSANDLKLKRDNTLDGVKDLRQDLNDLGDVINKLPARQVTNDIKQARNRARRQLNAIVDGARQLRKAAGQAIEEAADSAEAAYQEMREELAALSEDARKRVFESFGNEIVPRLEEIEEKVRDLPEQQKERLREATAKALDEEKELVALLREVFQQLNEPGMPKKVVEQIFAPMARGELAKEEATSRLVEFTGGVWETLQAKCRQRGFASITLGSVGSAAFIVGAEVTFPPWTPGMVLGALQSRDEYHWGYVWFGDVKVGITAEIAGQIQLGIWRGRPEDVAGGFVGATAGGGEGVVGNISAAWGYEYKTAREGDFLGLAVSGGAGVGPIPVEFAGTGGYTVVALPGKIIDRILAGDGD